MLFSKQVSLIAASILISLHMVGSASADTITAEYTAVDEVTNFNTYDFGGGVLLIKSLDLNSFGAGTVLNGYYQTYVNSHQLDGVGVSNPSLNNTGSGTGYELTMVSAFSATVTGGDLSGFGFNISSGNVALYLDTVPDYNFGTDSGFSDGVELLSSQVASGSGFISTGFGAVKFDSISSITENSNVYGTNSIDEATALFALDTTSTAQINGVTSVAGSQVESGDFLFATDGNLLLTQIGEVAPVPLPLSAWMFGSALISLVSFTRRKDKQLA